MFDFFVRKTAMFVIALGLLLNGAFPCCACTDTNGKAAGMSTALPGMTMQQLAMHPVEKGSLAKGNPCNSTDGCFAFCTCAIPVLAVQHAILIQSYHYGDGWFARDVNRDGLAIPPNLPPPIA